MTDPLEDELIDLLADIGTMEREVYSLSYEVYWAEIDKDSIKPYVESYFGIEVDAKPAEET